MYKAMSRGLLAALIILTCTFPSVSAQDDTSTVTIDAKSSAILKEMGHYLAETQQFSLQAEITVDKVLELGRKIQIERQIEIFLRRPDGVKVSSTTEIGSVYFWYDGREITLYFDDKNAYARDKAPVELDAALKYSVEKLGINLPIVDFLFTDPYSALAESVQSSTYLGTNRVRGQICHHLAFVQEDVDWQIWVDAGSTVLPKKLVVTYKNEPTSPQYTAVFTNWNLSPRLPNQLFSFEPPTNADQIQFFKETE